jgi:hypothetical protein
MLISSITSRSMLRIMAIFCLLKRNCSCRFCGFTPRTDSGIYGANANWKNEWIVTPPALIAATPVGATTIIRFGERSRSLCRNVVLPVPARPVKNRLTAVSPIKRSASSNCGFSIVPPSGIRPI